MTPYTLQVADQRVREQGQRQEKQLDMKSLFGDHLYLLRGIKLRSLVRINWCKQGKRH